MLNLKTVQNYKIKMIINSKIYEMLFIMTLNYLKQIFLKKIILFKVRKYVYSWNNSPCIIYNIMIVLLYDNVRNCVLWTH